MALWGAFAVANKAANVVAFLPLRFIEKAQKPKVLGSIKYGIQLKTFNQNNEKGMPFS